MYLESRTRRLLPLSCFSEDNQANSWFRLDFLLSLSMICLFKHSSVIQGNHVDVGYTDNSDVVVNKFFHKHIPLAFQVKEMIHRIYQRQFELFFHQAASELAKRGGVAQLKYTTQSWFLIQHTRFKIADPCFAGLCRF